MSRALAQLLALLPATLLALLTTPAHAARPAAPTPSAAPPLAASSLDRLLLEVDALRRLLGSQGVLLVLGTVALAWLGHLLLDWLVRKASRSGYAKSRWLIWLRLGAKGALALWVAAVVLRELLSVAPLISLILFLLFVAGALLSFSVRIQQILTGLLLIVRGSVRDGDRLSVGSTTGTVEHIGIWRLRLRTDDDALVLVPTSSLNHDAVTVAAPRRLHPVQIRLQRERPFSPREREQARRTASLCPFRSPGSPVRVETEDPSDKLLLVQLQTWSPSAADDAQRCLRAALSPLASDPPQATAQPQTTHA